MKKSVLRKTRVFLIDDHSVVREGLRRIIDNEPDLEVCGEAATSEEALNKLPPLKPALAVVDLSLEGEDGLKLIQELRRKCPAVLVLVMSMHEESIYAERALRAGAKGYIMKRGSARDVLGAMRRVLDGKLYLSEPAATGLVQRLGGAAEKSPFNVTRLAEREFDIFRMIGQGIKTTEIAERLFLSRKTVEWYRERLKQKLGLPSGPKLTQFAIRWMREHKADL
jgi:DNA-binding NarL/FixJ family response regulator